MRRSPWTLIFLLAAALVMLTVAQGCSSRRKSAPPAEVTPPPGTPESTPETTEEAPPRPPSSTEDENASARLQDAFFDYDEASLRDDGKQALEADAKYMESHARLNVIIEGHCDERGSVEYNLALGEKRARAAKEYLVSYGIKSSRMTTISYGKERPFDQGHNEEAWAKNRRAHFVAK
jgi:peptidoglycan-associated lipoprotein